MCLQQLHRYGAAAAMLEGRAVIQRNLERLGKRAERSLTQFKDTRRLPHVRWNSTTHKERLAFAS